MLSTMTRKRDTGKKRNEDNKVRLKTERRAGFTGKDKCFKLNLLI